MKVSDIYGVRGRFKAPVKYDSADFSCYAERDQILRELGYSSYSEYLSSDLWASIRQRVLAKYGFRCMICSGRACQAHHRRYTRKNLSGETIGLLVALCRECHEKIEFDSDGHKRVLGNVEQKFKELRGKRKGWCNYCLIYKCKRNQRMCRICKRERGLI